MSSPHGVRSSAPGAHIHREVHVMPTPEFLPTRETELLAWSLNFSTKITATPTAFGLVAAQATAYATLHSTFSNKLTIASDPGTNSKANVEAKNLAKFALIDSARDLVRQIQGVPTVT